ncbi:hypothetical protein BDZ89DRAFT_991252 [Hymenopellis radicata]|nr:hypothetical protein BDZ89DRAFT_991252 [Hymenopellis radicata]
MALDAEPEMSFLGPIDDYILGNAPLDDVVHRLTHWATQLNPPPDGGEFGSLWDLWSDFNQVAQRAPEKQDRLVELLLAIKNLPHVLKPDDERLTCWGGRFWEDLPIFGPNMRESWNFFDPEDTEPHRDLIRKNWIHLNAFVARITDAQVSDFDLYAIWELREALEHPVDSTTNVRVQAAAQWIFFAGLRLYQSEKIFEHGPLVGDPARGGPLFIGERGFTKERWMFWKQRFEALSTDPQLSDDARRVADEALQAIITVENKFTI